MLPKYKLYFFLAGRQAPGSIFTVGNGEQCLGSDRATGGVCLSRNQCNTQGGKAIGFCGVFATCCSREYFYFMKTYYFNISDIYW